MEKNSEQHKVNYEYYMRHRRDPEGCTSVNQMDQLPIISVQETEARNPLLLVPFKIYSATDLKNGKYLLRDETGEPSTYDADWFEVLSSDQVRKLKETERYQPHRCPACGEFEFSMEESYEICQKCGWVDSSDLRLHIFTAEEHGELYRERKIYFREWRERMPEGRYAFRRNRVDGYLISVQVGKDDMIALTYNPFSGDYTADGRAWADLERIQGNLFVPEYFLLDYMKRAEKSTTLLKIPIIRHEKGTIRLTSKGGDPTRFRFGAYMPLNETDTLARIYSYEDEVPVNICLDADWSDWDLEQCDICEAKLWADEYEIKIFPNEEEYQKADINMAPISMIPCGTFPADPDQQNFQQNALILFSGKVKEVEWNPRPKDDKPLLRMLIETYALTFNLFCYEDEPVEPGFIVHGQVWLNGELRKACKEESGETG